MKVVRVVLVSASELVTSEISTPDTPGEPAGVRMAEIVCAPELVAIECVVSDSL